MDSVSALWASRSGRQKIVAILAALAVFAAVLAIGRVSSDRDMALLYGGLDTSAAGEVIQALEAQGVAYEVRAGSIFVDAARRDVLRMTLAGQGLPANGAQGYELLDSLSGFSTTSQMFDAAYWRAKEGELARTILASRHIRSARVHISAPSTRSFQRDRKPTAAVTVTSAGAGLTAPQAEALQYLVASSVPGLAPEDVAVIDGDSGLVSTADETIGPAATDRAEALRGRIERLLEARVGPGNVVVEVSMETVTESETLVERRIDPESRVAISTEVEERSDSARDTGGGDVTVASNLPEGDGAGDGNSSSSQNTEARQLTNFEVSETQREVLRTPGGVRRLTVAVLVNEAAVNAPDGTTVSEPRSAEELDALRDLVASAAGVDEARGDVVTLQSMAFEPVPELGTEALPAAADPLLDLPAMIRMGLLAAVALILGLFVVRPVLLAERRALPAPANPDEPIALASDRVETPALPSPDDIADPAGDGQADRAPEDPVERLRRMIDERQDETMQILESWMDESSANAERG